MYHHNDGISLLDTELPDGLHKSSGWVDCPPDVTDDQGNCLVITYLRFAEGQYWGSRIYFPANDGNAIYVNNCSIGVWQGWERITTDAPPQEFDLPLAEGWTGLAKYYKTQENICFIELDILKNATIQNGEVLATLPEGFRPSYLRMQPAIVYSPHGSTAIGVSPTGSVLFGDMSGSPSARNIYATLVFVAAS